MARTTSVSLNDHDADFIDAQVEQGSYDSPSDVVSAGLELLEQAKTKALVEALIEAKNRVSRSLLMAKRSLFA